jgi:plastocyanin
MRFYGLTLAASVIVLGACGGEKKAADSTAATTNPAATDTTATAAAAAPAAGAMAMAPITGKTWEIKMVGDDKGYRFEPANLTIKVGDGVKFEMETGGPHNLAFDMATVPADVKAQMMANMPNQETGEMSSKMMMTKDEAVVVSFAKVKPGKYAFHCTPHLAMGMKGEITVQ